MLRFEKPVSRSIIRFLTEVGLEVRRGTTDEATFVPGIQIVQGVLVVDEERMRYPGDLLHEAGHLAVLLEEERSKITGDAGSDGGAEMAAIAWSYAATVHLGLDPAVVFHRDGYRGGSASLIENFASGRWFGVPLLEWMGITTSQSYPKMISWLRMQ